jgi:hypothetical protein
MEELKGFDIPLIGSPYGLLIRIVLEEAEKQLFVVVLDNSKEEYVASIGFDFAMCGLFDEFVDDLGIGVVGHLKNNGEVVGEVAFHRNEIILSLEKYGMKFGLCCTEKHYEIISGLFRKAGALSFEEPKQ